VQQRLAGHPWPSPVVGLFLLDSLTIFWLWCDWHITV
jgi:hypothetical protein